MRKKHVMYGRNLYKVNMFLHVCKGSSYFSICNVLGPLCLHVSTSRQKVHNGVKEMDRGAMPEGGTNDCRNDDRPSLT